MPQFADRKHVVSAIKFDGSDASALAIVKEFGSGVAMSANDGKITITLSRKRQVQPGQFVFRKGDLVTALDEGRFFERFVPLSMPSPYVFTPLSPADTLGEYSVGGLVVEIDGDHSDEMEILEIADGYLVCDSAYGEKRLKPEQVRHA